MGLTVSHKELLLSFQLLTLVCPIITDEQRIDRLETQLYVVAIHYQIVVSTMAGDFDMMS